jgi:hypothetical protein
LRSLRLCVIFLSPRRQGAKPPKEGSNKWPKK